MPPKLFFMRGAQFVCLIRSTLNVTHLQVYRAAIHVQRGARKCSSVLWTLPMQHLGPESWPFHMPSSKCTKVNALRCCWYIQSLFQSHLDLLCIYSLGGWALGCILLALSAVSNAWVFGVFFWLSRHEFEDLAIWFCQKPANFADSACTYTLWRYSLTVILYCAREYEMESFQGVVEKMSVLFLLTRNFAAFWKSFTLTLVPSPGLESLRAHCYSSLFW